MLFLGHQLCLQTTGPLQLSAKSLICTTTEFPARLLLGSWTANLRTKPAPLISVGKSPTAAAGTKIDVLAAEEETYFALED